MTSPELPYQIGCRSVLENLKDLAYPIFDQVINIEEVLFPVVAHTLIVILLTLLVYGFLTGLRKKFRCTAERKGDRGGS
jgi:hypothetical protein